MAKQQLEVTLTLRLWDTCKKTDDDWHIKELERIAGMVSEGFTAGEIVGDHDETGWWELSA